MEQMWPHFSKTVLNSVSDVLFLVCIVQIVFSVHFKNKIFSLNTAYFDCSGWLRT